MNYWIFQGNPKHQNEDGTYFDVTKYVLEEKVLTWGVRQKFYVKDIQIGDSVFIWRADGFEKGSGGIIAKGEICSEVGFDETEGVHHVDIKVLEHKITPKEGMILRSELKDDLQLGNLQIIKQPTGTNFKLSEHEFDLLCAVWEGNRQLIPATTLNKIEFYLQEFKEIAPEWFKENSYVSDYYAFYQGFKEQDFNHLQWKDVQELGDHIHALGRNALARKRAFGKPNREMRDYQRSFDYLINGEDELKIRIEKFRAHPDYRIPFLGDSSVSEIVGNLFPEALCFYNLRDQIAVEKILGIRMDYQKEDNFTERLYRFNETLDEYHVRLHYETIVGRQTHLPLNLELDQFFSYLFKQYGHMEEVSYWKVELPNGINQFQLYQNRQIITMQDFDIGDFSQYRNRKELKNAYKKAMGFEYVENQFGTEILSFINEMKLDDYVILTKENVIRGYGKVCSNYIYDEQGIEAKHYREIEWIELGTWDLEKSVFDSKKIVKIEDEELIENLLLLMSHGESDESDGDEVIIGEKPPVPYKNLPNYEIQDFLNEVFISEEKLERLLFSLDHKKNVILQGPPGVGKTFLAKRLAYVHRGVKCGDCIQMVQFHQSYSYEEFIRGYKPTRDGNFALKDGVFYRFCQKAKQHPNENYYFIIDEINRGNMSKIFGELLMLLEADKRGSEFAMPLTYMNDEENEAPFYIPENVYVIGMMNTADRSLAVVDYALRRRFAFIEIEPAFESEAFKSFFIERASEDLYTKVINVMKTINTEIEKDSLNLGRGYRVGHSFFTPTTQVEQEDMWFKNVMELEIEPLLREYWFDDEEKVATLLGQL